MREEKFQHYNLLITNFYFRELSCNLESITVIFSDYYPINVTTFLFEIKYDITMLLAGKHIATDGMYVLLLNYPFVTKI